MKDKLVKSRHSGENRSPGNLNRLKALDSGFCRNDKTRTKETFYKTIMNRFLFIAISILIGFFIFSAPAPAEAQVVNPPRLSLTLQMSGLINPVHITHAGDASGR